MAAVELESVGRHIDGTTILDDVSLTVADGEFVGLIGASGSGKTSVLRVIAGFDAPSNGTISIGGQNMADVATRDRDISMVSQHNTLFPTHRVRGNLRDLEGGGSTAEGDNGGHQEDKRGGDHPKKHLDELWDLGVNLEGDGGIGDYLERPGVET